MNLSGFMRESNRPYFAIVPLRQRITSNFEYAMIETWPFRTRDAGNPRNLAVTIGLFVMQVFFG